MSTDDDTLWSVRAKNFFGALSLGDAGCTLMIIDQVIRGNKVLKLNTGSVYLRCEVTIKNRRDDRYLACLFLSRVVRA